MKAKTLSTTNPVYIPLEEIRVLRLPYEARSHHDCLEALTFDRPQIAFGDRCDRRRPLAVVQNGQFAQHLGAGERRQVFALARHLHASI